MIFFATVSDDDDRDVERRGANYVTSRFIISAIVIGGIILTLAYIFILGPRIRYTQYVTSQANLFKMAKGLNAYAEANNDGLPPVYLLGAKDGNDRPITWANQIFDYVGTIEVFNNAANPEEGNTMLGRLLPDGTREDVGLSYGMLAGADTARRYEIHDGTVLLVETIGSGAAGSYNPMPLGGEDGFMIGYNNSNTLPDADTDFVTRLAFTGTAASPLSLTAIHEQGIVGIRADGSLAKFSNAAEAFPVSKSGRTPSGQWAPY